MHLQLSSDLGPRVGHLVADRKTKCFGRRVQGSNARPAGGIDGEDEGSLRINRLARRGVACLRCDEAQRSAIAGARLKRCAT